MPYRPPPSAGGEAHSMLSANNSRGILMSSIAEVTNVGGGSGANTTLNATGNNRFAIGKCILQGGSGSKTISSAGGKIHFRVASAGTLANVGTVVTLGIQDVAATGINDTTFDVSRGYVGGVDTWPSGYITATMALGTKTITHGDIIAVGLLMVTRAGADSITVQNILSAGLYSSMHFPYSITNGVRAATIFPVMIEFDDGTIGWLEEGYPGQPFDSVTPALLAYNSGSTPDEYAAVFKVPFKTTLSAFAIFMDPNGSTSYEFCFYTDPLGTPVAAVTVTPDPDFDGNAGGRAWYWVTFPTAQTLEANTYYAVALRPTSATNVYFCYYDLGTGKTILKTPSAFGQEIKYAGRTNQTGAFVETQTYHLPILLLRLGAFLG